MSTAENESPLPAPTARRAAVASSSFPVAAGSVAPVGRRVAAFALDSLLVLVAVGIGYGVVAAAGSSAAAPLRALPLLLAVGVGVGQWIAEARSGATVGNALTGIRTLSASTGGPPGLLAVLVRNVVIGLGALVCGLGQWVVVGSGAWDRTPAQRGWHDKAAGTVVLRADAVRRSSGRATAAPASRSTTVPRVEEPVQAPAAPVDASRLPSGDPGGLIPLVPVFAAAPLAPAPAPEPVAPASVPTWSLPELPQTDAAPPAPMIQAMPDGGAAEAAHAADPLPLIRALPERGAVEPAHVADPLPPMIRPVPDHGAVEQPHAAGPQPPVIDTPVGATPAPTRTRRGRAPSLDDLLPDVPEAPRGTVDPELEHTRLREPGPGRAGTTGLRLLFDTGEQVDVTGDGLVGRNPGPEPSADHVVAIDDPERSISKVHLAFGLEPDGRLWVMDRGSTNGTVVVGPDGRTAALVAGARATVAPGWTVRFGRRTVQVTQP